MTDITTSVTFSKQNTPGGHLRTILEINNNTNRDKLVVIIICFYLFFES